MLGHRIPGVRHSIRHTTRNWGCCFFALKSRVLIQHPKGICYNLVWEIKMHNCPKKRMLCFSLFYFLGPKRATHKLWGKSQQQPLKRAAPPSPTAGPKEISDLFRGRQSVAFWEPFHECRGASHPPVGRVLPATDYLTELRPAASESQTWRGIQPEDL